MSLDLASLSREGIVPDAQFLYRELQICLAQRAVDLLNLPHGLNKTAHVQEMAHIYLSYLCIVQSEEYRGFTDMLQQIITDRSSIPMDIARGVASQR